MSTCNGGFGLVNLGCISSSNKPPCHADELHAKLYAKEKQLQMALLKVNTLKKKIGIIKKKIKKQQHEKRKHHSF